MFLFIVPCIYLYTATLSVLKSSNDFYGAIYQGLRSRTYRNLSFVEYLKENDLPLAREGEGRRMGEFALFEKATHILGTFNFSVVQNPEDNEAGNIPYELTVTRNARSPVFSFYHYLFPRWLTGPQLVNVSGVDTFFITHRTDNAPPRGDPHIFEWILRRSEAVRARLETASRDGQFPFDLEDVEMQATLFQTEESLAAVETTFKVAGFNPFWVRPRALVHRHNLVHPTLREKVNLQPLPGDPFRETIPEPFRVEYFAMLEQLKAVIWA